MSLARPESPKSTKSSLWFVVKNASCDERAFRPSKTVNLAGNQSRQRAPHAASGSPTLAQSAVGFVYNKQLIASAPLQIVCLIPLRNAFKILVLRQARFSKTLFLTRRSRLCNKSKPSCSHTSCATKGERRERPTGNDGMLHILVEKEACKLWERHFEHSNRFFGHIVHYWKVEIVHSSIPKELKGDVWNLTSHEILRAMKSYVP